MIDFSTHPLVETDWLANHLDDPDIRVVDARWRADGSSCAVYRAGHIPGAVHIDWELDLSHRAGGLRYALLPPEWFAMMMRAVGIGDGTRVVVYAEADTAGAAYLWWALRHYGHDQVAVLNGGIGKWLAEGRTLDSRIPEPAPAAFTPRLRPGLLATAAEIERALAEPGAPVRLIDTRPIEQYTGQAVWTPRGSLFLPPGQEFVSLDGRRVWGGRIPGAIHWHASRNFDPVDWTYLPPDQLRALAQRLGVEPEHRAITYCGSGLSAAVGLFALRLADYPNVALYDAAWEEWGTDLSRPIERGLSQVIAGV
jgi:thiosulfate/3-mercaptopyruvate sulfurtransferase